MPQIKHLLLAIVILCSLSSGAQNIVFKRLQKVEQKHPERLDAVATRYSKIFPNRPVAYFFMSKSQLLSFQDETEEKKQFRSIYKCVSLAIKAQKLSEGNAFKEKEEWQAYRNELKNIVYFYLEESNYTSKRARLDKKFKSFMGYEADEYVFESDLKIEFPESQKTDTLFYGLPTGKENVPAIAMDQELKMLEMINVERKKMGLVPVEVDSSLSSACRYHAYDMGTQNYFDHNGYDRGVDDRKYFANKTFDRISQFYNDSRLLNENIAAGHKEAVFTYKQWFESPGHYRNLFNPGNRKVGIGFVFIANSEYQYYWVFNAAE